MLDWMAWTWPTAAFFGVIAALLALFTYLAIRYPETPKESPLGFPSTRGDRLFISLLGAGFICLAWLGLVPFSMWFALIPCLIFAAIVFVYV